MSGETVQTKKGISLRGVTKGADPLTRAQNEDKTEVRQASFMLQASSFSAQLQQFIELSGKEHLSLLSVSHIFLSPSPRPFFLFFCRIARQVHAPAHLSAFLFSLSLSVCIYITDTREHVIALP